ncbi:hypothetical protein GOBAR_DD23199 [Gossypium barbadense]|nr:hypothetical protein GOBAR_DD23199 [Gossypium barbadense]
MPYVDPNIISCISPKVLDNREMWDAKLPLIVYWQQIPPPSQDMKELHKVDIRGKNDDDWAEKHKEHI